MLLFARYTTLVLVLVKPVCIREHTLPTPTRTCVELKLCILLNVVTQAPDVTRHNPTWDV